MDICDLHGLTGVQCNLYGYLWFLQIQTYNHSMLYIWTVVCLQWQYWHQLCFVSTKVNDLSHNKLCFVCLLYMGVLSGILYQNCVLQWCWQFVRICLQIIRIFCHDLTDRIVPAWHLWDIHMCKDHNSHDTSIPFKYIRAILTFSLGTFSLLRVWKSVVSNKLPSWVVQSVKVHLADQSI